MRLCFITFNKPWSWRTVMTERGKTGFLNHCKWITSPTLHHGRFCEHKMWEYNKENIMWRWQCQALHFQEKHPPAKSHKKPRQCILKLSEFPLWPYHSLPPSPLGITKTGKFGNWFSATLSNRVIIYSVFRGNISNRHWCHYEESGAVWVRWDPLSDLETACCSQAVGCLLERYNGVEDLFQGAISTSFICSSSQFWTLKQFIQSTRLIQKSKMCICLQARGKSSCKHRLHENCSVGVGHCYTAFNWQQFHFKNPRPYIHIRIYFI